MKKRLISIGLFFWLIAFCNCNLLFGIADTTSLPVAENNVFNKHSIRLGYLNGFLIPHHEDMQHMYKHISGVQVQILHELNPIEKSKNAGLLGYSLSYYDLGSEVNGKAISAALLVESSLFKWHNIYQDFWFKSSFQFGLGLGYLTQRYDPKTNPYNRAIGSHVNGYMQIGMLLESQIYRGVGIHASIGMAHFSNASWKYPNLGVNLPFIQYGLNILTVSKNPIRVKKDVPLKAIKPWQKTISFRIGKKEVDLDDNRSFINGLLEFTLEKFRNRNSNFRYSVGMYHDRTYQYRKFETLADYAFLKCTELTFSVGYETRFGKWGVLTDLGFYAYKPDFKKKTPYYEAIGISYQLNGSYKAIMRLKANKTTADFAEFGLLYRFNE